MELRALKDRAAELFLKGKFARAAEAYQAYCTADAKDLQSRLRLGDAWSKAGKREAAIEAYLWAVDGFSQEGFVPRAIAASKLVLELEPGHAGVRERLARLYARRASPPSLAPRAERFERPAAEGGGPPGSTGASTVKERFTELELDETDSILHLVEAAAGEAAARLEGEDEETLETIEIIEERADPAALARIPLFSDLASEAFLALFERCPLLRLEVGHRIVEQGMRGDAFYVVCSGKVNVLRKEGDSERPLAELEEGAFFGEMALLSQAPRSASVVVASDDTQVLEIGAPLLRELSARYPSIARALKRFCRQRLLSNVMASAELFRPFSRGDRRELVKRFGARDAARGEVIVAEGTMSDGLYVVLSGAVEVRRQGRTVSTLGEGELFGEMSLLTRSPASATVIAARHTSLLRLPKEDFEVLILSHPQILELVANLTDERQRANQARERT